MVRRYVTRYALSIGIEEHDGEITDTGYFVYGRHGFLSRKDYFATFEEAKVDAEKRRNRKIAALEKQLSRLRQLSFTN